MHPVHSPELVNAVVEGKSAESFRLDLEGLCLKTGSDGDPGIPGGVGAGMPATDWTHSNC